MRNKQQREWHDWVRPNEQYNFKKGDNPHWIFIVVSLFVAMYLQIKWMGAQPSLFEAANNITNTL